MLSANLYAKERRGAKLIITKTDGQQIRGELITVKPNSLLLLSITGRDVSVDVADIKVIRIVKKSKFWTGAVIGLCVGIPLGYYVGDSLYPPEPGFLGGLANSIAKRWGPIIGGLVLALIGGAIGYRGESETIQIEGMTDFKIHKTLEYLRKKARIRNYK